MIRDLNDKGLGENKVLCSSSGVKLPWSTTMQAPRQRSPCQRDRSPAIRWLLALRTALTWIPLCRLFLVASSLSPCLTRQACLGALCSAFCWSFLLLLDGELDCWSSHRWRGVNGRRSRCRFVRMVLVEQADELSKMLDC